MGTREGDGESDVRVPREIRDGKLDRLKRPVALEPAHEIKERLARGGRPADARNPRAALPLLEREAGEGDGGISRGDDAPEKVGDGGSPEGGGQMLRLSPGRAEEGAGLLGARDLAGPLKERESPNRGGLVRAGGEVRRQEENAPGGERGGEKEKRDRGETQKVPAP